MVWKIQNPWNNAAALSEPVSNEMVKHSNETIKNEIFISTPFFPECFVRHEGVNFPTNGTLVISNIRVHHIKGVSDIRPAPH